MLKLVYIKDGEIHRKLYAYTERMEKDWNVLCDHPYPAWALASDDGDSWTVMNVINLHTCWHRVPDCRWSREFLDDTNDGFDGRRFDYSPQLKVYCYYKYRTTAEGYDEYYHTILDTHGNMFSYITNG